MSSNKALAQRLGSTSPSPPASPIREAGSLTHPVTLASPPRPSITAPPPTSRKRAITLLDFWSTVRPGKTGRLARTKPRGDTSPPRGGRRRPRDPVKTVRPIKLQRPLSSPTPGLVSPHTLAPALRQPVTHPTTSSAEVLYMGPVPPRRLSRQSPHRATFD